MKQIPIPFPQDVAPTLDNFVAGENSELVDALRCLLTGSGEPMLYLWGAAGSGRSHLLRAAVSEAEELGMKAAYLEGGALGENLRELDLCAVDDVDRLDEDGQIGLFHLYNALREKGARLIASGPLPPAELQLRQDLVTRLGWGLVYQVRLLSDADKEMALSHHALKLGFELPPEVLGYLMHHGRRDLPSLVRTVELLDLASRERKRPVTVPLLKEIFSERTTCV